MSTHVGIEEIRELSRRSRRILYGEEQPPVPVVASVGAGDGTISMSLLVPLTQGSPLGDTESESSQRIGSHIGTKKALRNALKLIQAQIGNEPPFLFRSEVAQVAMIRGAASVVQAEKEALQRELVVKHDLPRAKTNVCLWEVTDLGYEWLKQTRPVWRSKGGYKHKFVVHRIAHTYRRRGYDSQIEYRHHNGKLVDLRLSDGEEVLYVEVCASPPIEKELTNIQKDLESHPLPTELIMAVTERKMREPLEEAVRQMGLRRDLAVPVRVALAGDMIDFLEFGP